MKLLQAIDRLKLTANAENKTMRVGKLLREMASPKRWALRNGGTVDVHTPFTTRARELMMLYQARGG